ncbi:tripartite motif containing 101 isoform X3 [Simochromis diagramma]|uniref:tripartite motif containing 101 isoform X3 n=1 Tax=Simochromis diagramma TaxID=43689 RepID=UPI001A7E53B7|nr:tripartite motif containing 101 isoform X3 [Simochromis diagramma]
MSLSADLSCLQGSRGAEREVALTTLEKQLICPICLEIFNKPVVILPCEHNLCRKCANELYQPSLFHARTTMSVNSGRFRCPSCRQEVLLDRHGVYGLQRNLLVENIIDIYKEEINSTRPLPPPSPPPPAHSTCSDHEGEKVNIYCLTCQVPTCSLCKVFGAHQSCEVAPLSAIYQQQKDQLREGVASLRAFSDKVQTLINELEETCRHIEAMAQRISSEQEEKTGHARALVRCHDDSMAANSRLAESAASSMEEPNMAAFVQSSAEMITKVKAASASGPSETLRPGYERLSRYRFNFSEQERALKGIDFIKASWFCDISPVVKDVPEEPELDPEPKEPKDSLIQNTEPNGNQQAAEEVSEQETPELDSGHITEGEEEAAAELAKEGGERQEGMSTQQAVTLFFYLLALLVILQRAWAYVGCFICT